MNGISEWDLMEFHTEYPREPFRDREQCARNKKSICEDCATFLGPRNTFRIFMMKFHYSIMKFHSCIVSRDIIQMELRNGMHACTLLT